MIIDPINFHHHNNMYSPQLVLLLLLIVVASNILCSASLALPMVHSRSLAMTISKKSSRVALQSLDYMMEPLRGFRDGYLITLNLGSPPQLLQAYVDTGSDLTWVPCGAVSFDCVDCDDYKDYKLPSTFSPLRSSTSLRDLCASPLCAGIHSSDNPYDACAVAGCSLSSLVGGTCPRPCPSFAYNYGAGGVVVGSLTRDTLRVHTARDPAPTAEVPSFCFGCVGSSYREPIGIAGFGKGALSLPSQLGLLRRGFSHCFLPFKFANNPNISSPLVVGEVANSSKENSHFTPMLKNPVFPNYYYIGLEGIGVGNGSLVEVPSSLNSFDPEGNGGLLIDSGTTYTHLPGPLYDRLLRELGSTIAYPRAEDVERRTGFDLCYEVPSPNGSALLPAVAFRFFRQRGARAADGRLLLRHGASEGLDGGEMPVVPEDGGGGLWACWRVRELPAAERGGCV
ncbi:putative aspartyl protease [Iris pallida]|uniref:Aspartyl protease n=1 Tax=Iris pallida TaxID=29817 RepID=A0AAX6I2Z2_IRIPA|nr:putative aspartyl protease [Iris pallida]